MRSQSLHVEYILIILLSSVAFYFSYLWYNENFKVVTDSFMNSDALKDINKLINSLENLQSVFSYRLSYEIKASGMCIYNKTFLYYSDCYSYAYNLSSTDPIVNINGTYYILSFLGRGYYVLGKYGYKSYQVCFDNKKGILIDSQYCSGMCFDKCNVNVVGGGEYFNITLG